MLIIFSLILSSCQSPFGQTSKNLPSREQISFEEWEIPDYFVPKRLMVVGLGDSLTQGVGDEKKKGGYFGRLAAEMETWKGVREVDAVNLAKRGRRSDQLIETLQDEEVQESVQNADVIVLTIGGNDLMKVVKRNFLELKVSDFYKELGKFETRLEELFQLLRLLNSSAPIVVSGLYNPFSIVTDEVREFEEIIADWNEVLAEQTAADGNSCFVPVKDLFHSNANLVYHTDFFHPNGKGYDWMAKRFIKEMKSCPAIDLEVE